MKYATKYRPDLLFVTIFLFVIYAFCEAGLLGSLLVQDYPSQISTVIKLQMSLDLTRQVEESHTEHLLLATFYNAY